MLPIRVQYSVYNKKDSQIDVLSATRSKNQFSSSGSIFFLNLEIHSRLIADTFSEWQFCFQKCMFKCLHNVSWSMFSFSILKVISYSYFLLPKIKICGFYLWPFSARPTPLLLAQIFMITLALFWTLNDRNTKSIVQPKKKE